MNTATRTAQTMSPSAAPAAFTPSTASRVAGAGFAAVLTLAMLLGVNTLAQVEAQGAQMAKSQPAVAASAAQT